MKKILNEIFVKRIFGCITFVLLLPILIGKFLISGSDIYLDEGVLNIVFSDKEKKWQTT